MVYRCHNPKDHNFYKYGARGIVVCERWRSSFENFLSDMGEKPEGTTLDRIDNNGPYSPENCRWATAAEQGRNQRTNVMLTAFGKTQCVTDWAKEAGVHRTVVLNRIYKWGWNIERAVSPGSKKSNAKQQILWCGQYYSIRSLAKKVGVPYSTLQARLAKGISIELAAR